MRRTFTPGSWTSLAALAWLVAACSPAAPAVPPSATASADTPAPAASATAAPTRTSTPAPTEPSTPTATPIPTLDPETLRIHPETLAQLRIAWTIDEPGNPNAELGCQDVACWMATRIGAYAFSSDGALLAVGVCLGEPTENVTNPRHYRFVCPTASEVRLYDAASGALQSSFGVGGFPISFAFHPDGNLLAVGMADRQIEVWDLAAGKKIHQLDHSSTRTGVISLAFSGDGTKLISEGDQRIQVWDWETPFLLGRFDNLTGVSLAPDGLRLATLFYGGTSASSFTARLYDLSNLPRFRELDLHGFVSFYRVLLTPDGSTLVALYPDVVEFWDPKAETYLGKTNISTQFMDLGIVFEWSYVFTPDGYLLVEPLHGPDATPLPPGVDEYYCGFGLWDPRSLGVYAHHISIDDCWAGDRLFDSYDIYRVVVSPDGLRWAADDGRGRLRVWAIDPAAPAVAPECLGTCGP